MTVGVAPFGPKPQFELSTGLPAVGGLLFFYVAGSINTKQDTFTTHTGLVANTNPIVLNSLGMPTTEIWLTDGLFYKIVYAPVGDTDPPSSAIWTVDYVSSISAVTATQDQWVTFGGTPTFVSATQFTLVGDQTTAFQVGRRLKTTITAGTGYHTITASSFGAGITTVTVVGTALDSGLSAVSYGLLTASNQSIPEPQFSGLITGVLSSVAGTNTITASATTLFGYATGQVFKFVPANTNTGATTIAINGLAAKNLFCGGAACVGGEIRQSIPSLIYYDGTQFNLIGPYLGGFIPTGQIKFPAAQNASADPNTLDDYDEATFTPGLTFGGASVGMTFTTQLGRRTKIGNRSFFNIFIQLSAKGSSTGNALITGLPETSLNTTGAQAPMTVWLNGVNTITTNHLQFYISPNTMTINPHYLAGGVSTVMTHADFNDTTELMVSGFYETAN